MTEISKLLEIMALLRNPEHGCPWDREQDFRSIAPYTLEEAYEVADAIERGRLDELADELGDLLLQVVFHAQMAAEADLFDFGDVVTAICEKMTRRHPHVFAGAQVDSAAAQTREWEQIKREEKGARSGAVLAGIATALPALTRAAKLGRRASGVGFDWPDVAPVRAKVDEELGELDEAVEEESQANIEAEIGDVLFAVANLCRHLDVDPEQSLRAANERFERRFEMVEGAVTKAGGDWAAFDPQALEDLWELAKRRERSAPPD